MHQISFTLWCGSSTEFSWLITQHLYLVGPFGDCLCFGVSGVCSGLFPAEVVPCGYESFSWNQPLPWFLLFAKDNWSSTADFFIQLSWIILHSLACYKRTDIEVKNATASQLCVQLLGNLASCTCSLRESLRRPPQCSPKIPSRSLGYFQRHWTIVTSSCSHPCLFSLFLLPKPALPALLHTQRLTNVREVQAPQQ